ncbi:hypothetical protein ACO0SA_003963 [Hanseniaspora valbyensis]
MLNTQIKNYCQQSTRFYALKSSGSTLSKRVRKYPIGKTFHNYEIENVQSFPELNLVGVLLEHQSTGSKHLHIDSTNNNNVFSLAFKTNPPDATGVPHILEHTTLCGSDKYPVKDPFFKMLNRSLSNFMNAMTAHDYTYYPFSTTNEKDFMNLMDVYLDCTIHPMLRFRDFLREGWRLENEKVDDKSSPLQFKGVVYNEMKGQTSNLQYKFYIRHRENLYPSLNNSGGDPNFITDLAYDDLVDFHKVKYHPSNMKTFSFGNIKLETILEKVHNSIGGFGKKIQHPMHDNKQPLDLSSEKVIVIEKSAIDPMLPLDRQVTQSLTWELNKPQEDLLLNFKLTLLSNLVFDNMNSPFYKKIIETGKALEYSCNTGFESVSNRNFITVGFQGLGDNFKESKELEELISKIWVEDIIGKAETVFDNSKIQGLVNQLELRMKHQKANFGMSLLNGVLPLWVNKCDPLELMSFNERLEDFKQDFEERGPTVFTELIEEYILNKNTFKFTTFGDENYNTELATRETDRLEKKIAKLTDEDKEMIFERNMAFDKENKDEGDVEKLPNLNIKDIAKEGFNFEVKEEAINNVDIFKRVTSTNGITYIKSQIVNLENSITEKMLPYLSLYVSSLTTLGTSKQEYHEIEDEIKLSLGGIQFDMDTNVVFSDINKSGLLFELQGWALNGKSDKIFEFWNKILLETDFSINRKAPLKALIKSLASNTSSFSDNGHNVARSYAASKINKSYALGEYMDNIKECHFIDEINSKINELENDPAKEDEYFEEKIFKPLREINNLIMENISNGKSKVIVHSDSEKQVEKMATLFANTFVSEIKPTTQNLPVSNGLNMDSLISETSEPTKSFISFPFQVSHTSKLIQCCSYDNKDSASLQILANILTTKLLHPEIRERNGAYGGGASYSAISGLFNFYSYRDPNPLTTLKFIDQLCSKPELPFEISEEDILGAKLSIFQDVDSPVSPMNEGMSMFEYGLTSKAKKQRRDALLNCDINQVKETFKKYMYANHMKFQECVVGNKELMDTSGFEVIEPYTKH